MYNELYGFAVIGKLRSGIEVYVLDKKEVKTYSLMNMSVGCLMNILAEAEKEEDRFFFWAVEERKEKE